MFNIIKWPFPGYWKEAILLKPQLLSIVVVILESLNCADCDAGSYQNA